MIKKKLLKEDLDREFDKEYEKRFGTPQTRVFTSPEEFFKFREDVNKFADEFYEKHKQINQGR